MLSAKMIDKLNEQVTLELYSANLYLQMSSWCAYKGLENCAAFLLDQSKEEMDHMYRLFDYINDTGGQARLGAVEQPDHRFESLHDLFESTLDHERKVTRAINELAELSFTEKDFSSFNFLQWYVAEQHEEEKLFKTILDKVDLIGMEGRGLYHIDIEVGKIARLNPKMPMETAVDEGAIP